MSNSTVQVSVTEFRTLFPEFANTTKYPDTTLQIMLDVAQLYVSNKITPFVKENVQKHLIYLMAAHLTVGNSQIAAGNNTGGLISSAYIDTVTVTKQIPTLKSSLDAWLWQTTYGQQILALLKIQSTLGIYIGGQKENVFR